MRKWCESARWGSDLASFWTYLRVPPFLVLPLSFLDMQLNVAL